MIRIGIILIIGGIIASIIVSMFAYVEYQPNFILADAGQYIQVGPVKYAIEYEGIHKGDKETVPKHDFLKIRIFAENTSDDLTRISGGQFYLIDENDSRIQPTFGNFSEDLLNEQLEPHKEISRTTQFDIEFDEGKQYKIGIRPTKDQKSTDIGIICIINC